MATHNKPRRYTKEVMRLAKQFYARGWTIQEISAELNIIERTLLNWKKNENWQYIRPGYDAETALAIRINQLAERENKTDQELKEFDLLCEKFGNLRIKLAQAFAIETHGQALPVPGSTRGGDAAQTKNKATGEKRSNRGRKKKNDVSGITEERILEVLHSLFFSYQLLWWEKKNDPETRRNRFILKSRQIGATYYFAFEALADAIITGDNQIFLSASRDQAEVFKAYIIAFAKEHFEVELKGAGVLKLSNGAELRFLSTNSRTAQSYHGHLYVDECFWIPDFEKMWKVASGMAAHKKWRRTLFSTPSAISHQAYGMWSGDKYNKGRAEDKQAEFDTSHKALQSGALLPDKIWRHMVTVKDADAQGCDLFDIDELQTEYSKDDFANLFMCKFIDDAKSIFNLGIMMTCYANQDYQDYDENAPRPYRNRPVAIGYDPSRTRDNASLAILAIPISTGGKEDRWRVLKTYNFHGQNFQYQANRIREIVQSHNVKHIGIDTTGIGYGLFELVEQFYRRATPINYSNETKTQLVMKAIDVIENGRFEYEAGNKQITQAFMMINKTTSSSGVITYSSGRNNTSGHADVAWAIMHALHYEPISARKKSTVTFSST